MADEALEDGETPSVEAAPEENRYLPVRRWIPLPTSARGDLAVNVASTAAGLAAGVMLGPFAALIVPFANAALKQLVARLGVEDVFSDIEQEFIAQQLAPREVGRVAVAYNTAVISMMERLRAGERVRDDGFFPGAGEARGSFAHVALEGVLLKARDTYDQRKAERLGELYAWLAFHPEISPSHGNFLIELANRLTYTQLLLLGVFDQSPPWLPDWQSTGAFTSLEMGFVAEIEELGRQELVLRDDNRPVLTFTDVNPRQLKTVLNGSLLCEAMHLDEAESEDWDELIDLFIRLGKIEATEGEDTRTRMATVVPRGKPPDVRRVQLNHQVVSFSRPSVGLADFEGAATEDS